MVGIWLTLVVASSTSLGTNGADEYMQGTVYIDFTTGVATFKPGVLDKEHGAAYGYYNNTLNQTGWGVLEIQTNRNNVASDTQLMFAAGFLEGVMTAKEIWQNFINTGTFISDNSTIPKLKDFFAKQDNWTRFMIKSYATKDIYWRHVSYILAQFDGLYEGYKSAASTEWDRDVYVVQLLNGIGDYIDLRNVLNRHERPNFQQMSLKQIRRYIQRNGHCSALVKVLPGFENMFMSHSSWFIYEATMRIFKHYHLNVKDSATAATSLSFSSYAGYLVSLDDFYELSSGLVMLQTTNLIFNNKLYDSITPQSLFAWQRVRTAHMIARSGRDWFSTFSKYNSGTYNNQYMIVDLKQVRLNKELANDTLWVIEQIPGLVVGADQTTILRAGYWPSYNVPFYPVIYNMSGYPDIVNSYGTEFSYQLAPRAKIFRRDQGSVVDMQSMKAIMRYNDYKHDVYSEGNPCNAICCRGDLDPDKPQPDGCYDTKVADVAMALNRTSVIISGPTTSHQLPPFSWNQPPFDKVSHVGLPTLYNFDWISTEPLL